MINLLIELKYSKIINFKYKQMNIYVKDNLDVIIKLKNDNNDAIVLIKNRQVNKRLKHIDVVYHYIRDLQKHEKVNVNLYLQMR